MDTDYNALDEEFAVFAPVDGTGVRQRHTQKSIAAQFFGWGHINKHQFRAFLIAACDSDYSDRIRSTYDTGRRGLNVIRADIATAIKGRPGSAAPLHLKDALLRLQRIESGRWRS